MTDPNQLVAGLLESREARILLEYDLKPVSGSRFQPTGFPDLGAALYPDPKGDGQRLLVESPQSMANRLEAVCWDPEASDLVQPLRGMPYVRISGDVESASLLEAHRLNSPYVLADADFKKEFEALAGLGKGVVSRPVYAASLLHYDPNSLVHGSFMSNIKPGTARLERLLSSFIEAEGVQIAASGGVKVDRNDASGRDAGGAGKGFGNVVYHRTEYVARRIFVSFTIDLAGLRGLRLPAEGTRFVALLALFKIRAFVDGPMRLRSACDLELEGRDPVRARPTDFELPSRSALAKALQETISEARQAKCFAEPAMREVRYEAG